MITNVGAKQMEMERRDIYYVLSSYLRMYLFQAKNEDPEQIILPMFSSVPHPHKPDQMVKIVYVPELSPIATSIEHDGSNVPLTTPESEAQADRREDEYNRMQKRIQELETELAKVNEDNEADDAEPSVESTPESPHLHSQPPVSKARQALAEQRKQEAPPREPKHPEHELPPGTQSDYGGSRDPRDQKWAAADLRPEKNVNEEEEKEDSEFIKRSKEQ